MDIEVSDDRARRLEEYYLRDDVKGAMVRICEGREVGPTFPYGYGSRPDAVNFPGDFERLVEDGAVAFHGSVERWKNPLLIDEVDADELRSGWDLVIDIDCDDDLHFAKITAVELLQELQSFGIGDVSVKFSGNRGFHLGLRQEAFPDRVHGQPLAEWYPDLPRTIVSFLRDRLRERLAELFVDHDSSVNSVVYEDSEPAPYELVDIENDWGDRHLFRLPYSVNEKSWLVSLPVEPTEEGIMGFEKEDAAMDAVEVEHGFLEDAEDGAAAELVVDALDWYAQQPGSEDRTEFDGEFDVPEEAAPEEYFPPTIHNILEGLEDGRKRAVFILTTFLQQVGYDFDSIEAMLWEWNDRNKEALDETYIRTQLNWHERQDEPLMPPNWDANGFYKDMNVYEEDPLTEATANPVSYTFAKLSDDEDGGGEETGDGSEGGGSGDEKPTMECPYCGKEYQGETKWYRDHVRACSG
ncbi:MAG: hypothetical protein SVY41_01615 [Candidatus Nanohaloarchaea archaeon]|nr:hypothetical protein [Candidatus Nanohaloarchaea archaeon]